MRPLSQNIAESSAARSPRTRVSDTQGDAFFVAFPTATGAVGAAAEAVDALASGPIRVRIAVHTGTPHLTDEGYVGEVVHLGARIAAAGHGGQVLLSKETGELVSAGLTDLGASTA